MKKQFFAVRWGEVIRISGKVLTEQEAKRYCYGLATADMQVRPLGARRDQIQKNLTKVSWSEKKVEKPAEVKPFARLPEPRLVRVSDLKDQFGAEGPRVFLFCRACGSESSAHAGDYFNFPKDSVLRCGSREEDGEVCGEPLALVRRRFIIEELPLEPEGSGLKG